MDDKRDFANFTDERKRMVYEIKETYGLSNSEIFAAMLQVPRHKFVDRKNWNIAYSDGPIAIGYGQTMSQPYTVAFMTELVISDKEQAIRKELKKVLEVGTGSGYQAAILSELVKEVYTIEIVPELFDRAKRTLKNLGYKNVHVKKGSGEWGWKEKSPYDAIIITAAVKKELPHELIGQLKVGGVIVAPIGPRESQIMTRFTKQKDGSLMKEEFQNFVFVPFVEEKK